MNKQNVPVPEDLSEALEKFEEDFRQICKDKDLELAITAIMREFRVDDDEFSRFAIGTMLHTDKDLEDLQREYDARDVKDQPDTAKRLLEYQQAKFQTFLRMYNTLSEALTELKPVVESLERDVGMNTSRVHALKVNTPYIITTENAVYRVQYDDEFRFAIESDEAGVKLVDLKFLGNVQDSGEIFKPHDLPVVSTGDRMLFGNPNPSYITSIVGHVIEESKMN